MRLRAEESWRAPASREGGECLLSFDPAVKRDATHRRTHQHISFGQIAIAPTASHMPRFPALCSFSDACMTTHPHALTSGVRKGPVDEIA
jgi:hypothetical protein